MKRKAGMYLRISQDREGLAVGIKRQEQDCRGLAESLGWAVERVYSDNDISATSGRRRPAWEQLLKDLESGSVNAVLAYSSSRMYRRLKNLAPLLDLAKSKGIKIATVASGEVDLTTADGRMLAGILASVDQGEAERIGERVARAKLEARKAGRLNGGGNRPFGYERVRDSVGKVIPGGGLQVVPQEATLIREAVARVLQGEAVSRIAMDWNARGITTSGGARWKPAHVGRMLIGSRHDRTNRKRGTPLLAGGANWPPILTPEEVRAVSLKLEIRSKHAPPTAGRHRRYVLVGLLYCQVCGSKMLGSGGAYRCTKINGGCGKVSVTARTIEDALDHRIQLLREEGKGKDPSTVPTVAVDQEEQRAALAEVAEVEARIAELTEALANGTLAPALATATFEKLEARRQQAAERFAAVVPQQQPEWLSEEWFAKAEDWNTRRAAGELTPVELSEFHDMFAAYFEAVQVAPSGPRKGRARNAGLDLKRIKVRWAAW